MMTKTQRIEAAMERAEIAAADLLREAEQWSLTNRTFYDIRNSRIELFQKARHYARAMNAISRVRL